MAIYMSTEFDQKARDMENEALQITDDTQRALDMANDAVAEAERELDDAVRQRDAAELAASEAETKASALRTGAFEMHNQASRVADLERQGVLDQDDAIDLNTAGNGRVI